MDTPAPQPPDEALLLAHSEFLSGLASQLVRDASDAQDVVQETLLSAWKRPPVNDSSARGWFGKVARNHALQLFRSRSRRDVRERLAARSEGVPSTAEIVERENARHAVVEALLELHEPYRSVILLRYYEDLPPREVAARLGVPVETVRTRLKRGLALLRGELDRRYSTDRDRWLAALAPLVFPRLARHARLGASMPAGVGAALLIAGACFVALRWPGASNVSAGVSPKPAEPSTRQEDGANAGLAESERSVLGEARGASERAPSGETIHGSASESAAFTNRVTGRAIDAGGRPVPFADVLVFATHSPVLGGERASEVFAGACADAAGTFELEGLPRTFYLHAHAGEFVAVAGFAAEFERATNVEGLEVVLQPAWTIAGRVVDEFGAAVEAAVVDAVTLDERGPGRATSIPGASWRTLARPATSTDRDGRFVLRGVAPRALTLRAAHASSGSASLHVAGPSERLELTLETSAELELTSASLPTTLPLPASGPTRVQVVVRNALTGRSIERFTLTARQGRERSFARLFESSGGEIEFGLDAPGSWVFAVTAAGFAPHVERPADFRDGAHELELRLFPERSLSLRVVDRNGGPVREGRVLCEDRRGRPIAARIGSNYWTNVLPIGPRGDVELAGLPAREVCVRVRLPEVDVERRATFDLSVPFVEEQELRVDLDLGGSRREVELRLTGLDGPALAQECSIEVRDELGQPCAVFSVRALGSAEPRVLRPLRCWVQRFDGAGTLAAQSLQTLESDSLSRDRGPRPAPGLPARVTTSLPLGACSVRAICAGSAATAEVPRGEAGSTGSVELRFDVAKR
jgi:RNA polymerase sigma-70 factor (ECF subfamily)